MADENQPCSSKKRKRNTEMETKIKFSFSLTNKIGMLAGALDILKSHEVNLCHINSTPNTENSEEFHFIVICDNTGELKEAFAKLKKIAINFEIMSVPWFPKDIGDLDNIDPKTFTSGEELKAEHPGFNDAEYKKRRTEVAKLSCDYKHDHKIPRVYYTKEERNTWGTVYNKLVELYPDHACATFNRNFQLLQTECNYRATDIPQLEVVSKFLQNRTGFRLRPAPGLISPRDFLAALALRTFYTTQYIRHKSKPEFTPEPDICHELLGHVPLFADEDFAQFAQEIGLASLGAPFKHIRKLSRLYWYTVEVGLLKEDGKKKVYGAALLSSAHELDLCLRDSAKIEIFDPEETCKKKPILSETQNTYFETESFDILNEKMRKFAETNSRPFDVEAIWSAEGIFLKRC
ncbi:tryptophan 5-hydroxylase 1-like isoform X1 [Crassostrea angulata]|uniref:tryptophan 5-hydroxylase 1-like isoform X1 n=1 Tax=Magallana angulata TaxID=2784310 RepID=UPI0022B1D1D1|nr:tryptophan 5-hydroxylase 1-like isoform X1 [Crassostrea angulata]